jgi:hypothetical protein
LEKTTSVAGSPGEKGQALFVAKPEPRAASWSSHARWESPREGWESPLIALAPSSRRNPNRKIQRRERALNRKLNTRLACLA